MGASFALVNLEHVERQLRERLDALGPAPRAELLHVLMLPDFAKRSIARWTQLFISPIDAARTDFAMPTMP